jgi:hypothetical protein
MQTISNARGNKEGKITTYFDEIRFGFVLTFLMYIKNAHHNHVDIMTVINSYNIEITMLRLLIFTIRHS